MNGFNPLGALTGFMNAIPSAQNNNPFGMLGSLFGAMGNYAGASEDPERQKQAEQINQVMPFIQSMGGFMDQMGGNSWQNQGPPIQGGPQGPAAIPGFRGNNYGMTGQNMPSQEVISLLSGLMGGGSGWGGNMGQGGFGQPGTPGALGGGFVPQQPIGYSIGQSAGNFLRNRLGGLFGGRKDDLAGLY